MLRGNLKTKTVALSLVTLGVTVFCAGIVRGFIFLPEEGEMQLSVEMPKFEEAKELQGLPDSISIPKIGVLTSVDHVGITFKGNMATSKNITHTGWYKYGTPPGSLGSAVVAGHVDNGFSLPGVFSDLDKLEVGDDVYLITDKGNKLHFVVVDKKTYPYKEVPRDELFAKNDAPRLNLVTCSGDWIPEEETDTHRLVVYTRLVG